MNIAKFKTLVNDELKTKASLMTMLKNAETKGNAEYIFVAREALNRRFPGWGRKPAKSGRATPITVRLRDIEKRFPTAKEAYIWLVDRFSYYDPKLFDPIDWETIFVVKGRDRNYFGRTPQRMFHQSPHLADDRNNYHRLVNGWYVNLNLNNDEKLKILLKFAAVAKLQFDSDWSWKVDETDTDASFDDL